MIFNDNTLEEQAKALYIDEYMVIWNERLNRYGAAWKTILEQENLTVPLESTLRKNLLISKSEEHKSQIQAKLDSGNYIAIDSQEEVNHLQYIQNLANSFVWPSANELIIRQQEEQELLSYMQNNPRFLPQVTSQSSEPTYLEILLQQHKA